MKNLFQWPRSGKNARRSSSLAAVLAAAAALCLIPGVARAAGNSQALQFGVGGINGYNSASDTYSYIYYGNYEEKNLVPRAPVKWRVLSVTGNDGVYSDGTNAEINPLFILSETSLGLMSDMSNIWEFRSSRAWCRAFAGIEPASYCEPAFTRSELNAVLETTKSDADPAVDHILNGEKVFLLSKEEAEEPAYGFINDSNRQSLPFDPAFHSWGLRSPYPADQNRMYCVGFSGDIRIADGTNPFEYSFLMCPACNLNPSAIIFSSPAVGGKTGINALAAVPSTDTREWKLTLADSSRQAFSAVTTALEGNRLTIAYSGTPAYNSASWHNEFISAIIKDKNDKIKYYGRIGRPSEESVSGTVHIDLSSVDVQDGDKLYVFSEQCNGDQQTDYASPLIEVSMNTSARAVRLGAAGIYGYTRASDHSLSYHHIYCGDINGAPVKWRVLDDKANTGGSRTVFIVGGLP